MKYIKKFNELKSSTYFSASDKLSDLGHYDRSQDLFYWGTKRKSEEYVENIPDRIKKYSISTIKINNDFNANFYFDLKFLDDLLIDSSIKLIEGKNDHLEFYFRIDYIPADSKSHFELYDKLFHKIHNGLLHSFIILEYRDVDGELKMVDMNISNLDIDIEQNRRSAVLIKKQLLDCLNGEYIDVDGINTYEKIRDILNKGNITLEYNLQVDDIYEDVKRFSVNKLYGQKTGFV